MVNCFCGMVDRRNVFSLISSRDHCQRSSPSRILDTSRAGFKPAQNLSLDFVEWSCAVVITTTPRRHHRGLYIKQSLSRWTTRVSFIGITLFQNEGLSWKKILCMNGFSFDTNTLMLSLCYSKFKFYAHCDYQSTSLLFVFQKDSSFWD